GILLGEAQQFPAAATDVLIEGNYIGTDGAGGQSLDANGFPVFGNAAEGVRITNHSTRITVGGTAAGARNVISGNDGNGVLIEGCSFNTVQGNYIGTDPSGHTTITQLPFVGDYSVNGNEGDGVQLTGSAGNNLIGGTTA